MKVKQKNVFCQGEGDKWFARQVASLEAEHLDHPASLLVSWLAPFSQKIENVIELGCGSGHRLFRICDGLGAQGVGLDPSKQAIGFLTDKFPRLKGIVGTADAVPIEEQFDLVHLGFFLYLVDRELYLSVIKEADRLTKPGGFLSIIDFDTPRRYFNSYKHLDGIKSFKQNNCDVFIASGLYTLVNKFQYSHANFYFSESADERISLALLYKETSAFEASDD